MKMKNRILLLAAFAAALSFPALTRADDTKPSLLDNALNDSKPADAKPDAKDAKPDSKDAKPAAQETAKPDDKTPAINPDAAKAVDDQDLTAKLTGQQPDAQGPEKMLDEVVQRMDDSAQRLKGSDPGAVTQETQRRIVMNLDSLIELVQQQQQQQQQSSSQSKGQGQQRQQNQQGNPGQGPHQDGGNSAAQQSSIPGGGVQDAQSNGQDITERGKEWGNLPERDRDLIVNGAKEEPLPAYRDAVQRYYKALADINKGSK
jgi:hypothetical protein